MADIRKSIETWLKSVLSKYHADLKLRLDPYSKKFSAESPTPLDWILEKSLKVYSNSSIPPEIYPVIDGLLAYLEHVDPRMAKIDRDVILMEKVAITLIDDLIKKNFDKPTTIIYAAKILDFISNN